MSIAVSNNPSAVVTEYGAPVQVIDIEVPDPEPGAIIVEILAATMCGTDVHLQAGDFRDTGFSHLPLTLGHEMVGRVVALNGDRFDAYGRPVRIGDRIAWAYAWCGHCYWCAIARQPTLCANARQYGWGPADEFPFAVGGFARYAYVMPPCKVVLVPEGIADAVAASATCAFRTIVHGFERVGGVEPHETVVIQGSGAVGLYALAYAIGSGARRVAILGDPDSRLEIAREWGADETISVAETDVSERVARIKEITDGRGADLVVECAGNRFALEEGPLLARRGGRYLVVGQSDPRPAQLLGTRINQGQLTIVGSVSADISHFAGALDFIATRSDRFNFSRVLSSSYSLSGVNDALAALASSAETKPVILPRS